MSKIYKNFGRLLSMVCLVASLIGILAIATRDAEATPPPKPDTGASFPRAYVEYRKAHPEQFRIRGGLRTKVERARRFREAYLRDTGSQLGVSSSTESLTALPLQAVVSGTAVVPVIPVEYNNVTKPYESSVLDDVLFSNNPTGTLTDYYHEVSYGHLNVVGTVFDWVSLPNDDTFYEGTNNGLSLNDAMTGKLIIDALDLLDPNIDFGQYDNDGPDGVPNSGDDDGFVDFAAFVHPEVGAECGNNSNIWSHYWKLQYWPEAGGQPYTTDDARTGSSGFIQIDEYVIGPSRSCGGNTIEIGIFAHEFGHAFGLPDLYDYDGGNSAGLGLWSLMAYGNWNRPSAPAHWDAWSKSKLGWLNPTLLTSQFNNLEIRQVETSPEAYQIVTGNGKYFLIENRQAVGYDQNLAGCGLLIYDIDESILSARGRPNNVENCGAFQENPPDHYAIALEQADGLCELEGAPNFGDDGDPFPGSANNRTFDSLSTPSVINYDGADPQVSVSNISDCGVVMTVDVQAFPLPDFGPGAIDVVFLIDNSGSYFDDLPNIQAQMPAIVNELTSAFPDIRFGLATFRDFPFFPFGGSTDAAYDPVLPLQSDSAAFITSINTIIAGGGRDLPESQYEALYQLLTGQGRDLTGDGDTDDQGEIDSSEIGWMTGRTRVVYLLTDASFHDSDTESYPGTVIEAAGRTAVRALLQPNDPIIFTMVAEDPSIFASQGQNGESPPIPVTEVARQAAELASDTLGGVLQAGINSAELATAVDVTILSLQEGGADVVTWLNIDVQPPDPQDPESGEKLLNVRGGVIPVAILGSESFDVTAIDPSTIVFGPNEASAVHDLSNPIVLNEHIQDVNLDGSSDLVSHFFAKESGLQTGDTEVCLAAETIDSRILVGCDVIVTEPRQRQ